MTGERYVDGKVISNDINFEYKSDVYSLGLTFAELVMNQLCKDILFVGVSTLS